MNEEMKVVVHYAIVEYIYSAEIGYCTHHLDEHIFICITQQKLTEDTSAYYMIVAFAYVLDSWFSHCCLLVVNVADVGSVPRSNILPKKKMFGNNFV